MFKLSNSIALFIKEDSKLCFKNVIHNCSNVIFEHSIKNDFYRSINGDGVVFDNNKYAFKIRGMGNMPCVLSDMYILDSSIIIAYDEFKKGKNSSYVFANFQNEFFSVKKFDKIWNESFKNDLCVVKEKLYENHSYELLNKNFVIPILHCKLISKKCFGHNKWNLELLEV